MPEQGPAGSAGGFCPEGCRRRLERRRPRSVADVAASGAFRGLPPPAQPSEAQYRGVTAAYPSPSASAAAPRWPLSDLRGLAQLAVTGTQGMARVVEAVHHTVLQVPAPLGPARTGRTRGLTGLVYRSVQGVAGLVGGGLDLALRALPGAEGPDSPPQRQALLAALNGVLGDHLAATDNPLALSMQWRQGGRTLDLASPATLSASLAQPPGSRLLVLVHGLCMHDGQWLRNGHDHGAALSRDAGWTPVYLRYNSGLPVQANGELLARQVQALTRRWPVPVTEIALLGHSMGGLVSRSALQHGRAHRLGWTRLLKRMVFLGTPHHGAPLERGGHGLQMLLSASPYLAPLARVAAVRSAGITDLRHGLPGRLPRGVACFAMAATTGDGTSGWRDHLVGDGLVSVRSALGDHDQAGLALQVPPTRRHVVLRANHFDLLDQHEVCARLAAWLS
jgi:PGAP1-like protein